MPKIVCAQQHPDGKPPGLSSAHRPTEQKSDDDHDSGADCRRQSGREIAFAKQGVEGMKQ
jgi:hypothetical protein